LKERAQQGLYIKDKAETNNAGGADDVLVL